MCRRPNVLPRRHSALASSISIQITMSKTKDAKVVFFFSEELFLVENSGVHSRSEDSEKRRWKLLFDKKFRSDLKCSINTVVGIRGCTHIHIHIHTDKYCRCWQFSNIEETWNRLCAAAKTVWNFPANRRIGRREQRISTCASNSSPSR